MNTFISLKFTFYLQGSFFKLYYVELYLYSSFQIVFCGWHYGQRRRAGSISILDLSPRQAWPTFHRGYCDGDDDDDDEYDDEDEDDDDEYEDDGDEDEDDGGDGDDEDDEW